MDRSELYGSMLEGKVSGINEIAAGGLAADLGKWAPTRNAEFAHDVLDGKLPDTAELGKGSLSADLGKWAEMNKEIKREQGMNIEKTLPGVTKQTIDR